jgi:hypothetical protein
MSRKKVIFLAMCALFLVALSSAILVKTGVLAAQDIPAAYAVNWWSVDNGGGTSLGGAYVLSGTIGQPDVGILSGGSYTLKGGFWQGLLGYLAYLPLINR